MTYSAEQSREISRLEARLQTVEVKKAYEALMTWAECTEGVFLFPISRGAFAAIHLGTRPDARAYADCEFAFKGASAHLRWWFRKPCFDVGLFGSELVLSEFDNAEILKSGEIACNLVDQITVERLCAFLNTRL